ncbi:hypothetical protein CCMA1212_007366 [Trichoderma ghanense]|uniref:Uncharacterized protein n=1 Tax=Trichoderma ghanense TaxID=65468 RepID=A0ABY2H0E3_9HYPO
MSRYASLVHHLNQQMKPFGSVSSPGSQKVSQKFSLRRCALVRIQLAPSNSAPDSVSPPAYRGLAGPFAQPHFILQPKSDIVELAVDSHLVTVQQHLRSASEAPSPPVPRL